MEGGKWEPQPWESHSADISKSPAQAPGTLGEEGHPPRVTLSGGKE